MPASRLWVTLLLAPALVHLVNTMDSMEYARNILRSTTYDVLFEKNRTITQSDSLRLLRGEYDEDAELVKPEGAFKNMTLTWGDEADYELYRITPRECYLCRYPPAHVTEGTAQKHQRLPLTPYEQNEILGHALYLLQQQRGLCIEYMNGYFGYRFCYDYELRQVPATKLMEASLVKGLASLGPEDPENNVYIMGKWSEDLGRTPELDATTDKSAHPSSLRPVGSSSIKKDEETLYSDQNLYLEQKWTDGTICDLNGLPRTTLVRVRYPANPVFLSLRQERQDRVD